MKPKIVRCPQCSNQTEYKIDNPARPFCSARCKLIDLGAWAEERYSIAGTWIPTDLPGSLSVDEDIHSTEILALSAWPQAPRDS